MRDDGLFLGPIVLYMLRELVRRSCGATCTRPSNPSNPRRPGRYRQPCASDDHATSSRDRTQSGHLLNADALHALVVVAG